MKNSIAIFSLVVMLGSGCVFLDLRKQVKYLESIATISKEIYESTAIPVKNRIVSLVNKYRNTGTLSDSEKTELAKLKKFSVAIGGYAIAHNAFIEAIEVIKTTGKFPDDLNKIKDSLLEFIDKSKEIKKYITNRS